MNILFLTFHGYREYILEIKNGFESLNHNVFNFSFFEMKDNKIEDDIIINMINEIIQKENINIMMFFLLPNNEKFIESIKCPKKIFYNFDDPISNNLDLVKYSNGIDIIFTPNKISKNTLKFILNSELRVLEKWTNLINYERKDHHEKIISILIDNDSESFFHNENIINEIKLLSYENNYELRLYGKKLEKYSDIYEGEYSQNIHQSSLIIYLKNFNYCHKKIKGNYDVLLDLINHKNIVFTYDGKQLTNIFRNDYNLFILNDNYLKKIEHIMEKIDKYEIIRKNCVKTIESLSIENFCQKLLQ